MKHLLGCWVLAVSLAAHAQPTPEGDRAACDGGDGNACRRLGTAIVNGDLAGRSFDEGIALLKQACSYGVAGACADVDRLLEQQSPPPPPPPQDAQPPPPPPSQGPQTRAPRPSFEERLDEPEWQGSRWGPVGRLAMGGTFLSASSSVPVLLNLGTGARFSLRQRAVNDTTFAPAIALLVTGQTAGGGSYGYGTLGLEARLEFVAVSSGGLLMPFFNCWLSGGVNYWVEFPDFNAAPSAWVGLGVGWNLFAHRGTWPNTSLGISANGTISGFLASLVAAVIIGVLHTEVRLEQVANGATAFHVLIGIGL